MVFLGFWLSVIFVLAPFGCKEGLTSKLQVLQVRGNYSVDGSNHNKPAYRKEQKASLSEWQLSSSMLRSSFAVADLRRELLVLSVCEVSGLDVMLLSCRTVASRGD